MDVEQIKDELRNRRGQWSRIAAAAGLSRKTVERLMADAEYNPTVGTLKAIREALSETGCVEPGPERSVA